MITPSFGHSMSAVNLLFLFGYGMHEGQLRVDVSDKFISVHYQLRRCSHASTR